MIKLVVLLKKRPELSDSEFLRFWFDEHGPLVRSHARARRICKYVQLHPSNPDTLQTISVCRGGQKVACDGIAEIYWNSLTDIVEAGNSSEGQRAAAEIVEHEEQFLLLPSLQFYLGQEHVFL